MKNNSFDIYIRKLVEKDALTSYRWRNDPTVWEYTGSRPNQHITVEIEKEWIMNVLSRKNEIRFAICISENDQYIGNVQLTDININEKTCEFHLFIGEPDFWGKGIATKATSLVLKHAKLKLGMKRVYLRVSKENRPAIRVYEKCGFDILEEGLREIDMIKSL